jgi:hypothetical protein
MQNATEVVERIAAGRGDTRLVKNREDHDP